MIRNTHTVTLYSLARSDDGGRWCDLATGVDQRQLVARIAHDGVEARFASRWCEMAVQQVGTPIEMDGLRRERYRLLAITVTPPSAADYSVGTVVSQCERAVKILAERTGVDWTFGYIGNCGVDSRGRFDDRSWYAFAAHPGRVGTAVDRIGGVPTRELDRLAAMLQGALQLTRVPGVERKLGA